MSAYENGTPVPPEGASSQYNPASSSASDTTARYEPPADATKETDKANEQKKKDKKSKGSKGGGSFGKSFAGGIVGAVVVVALVMGLWAGTPLFDGMKSSGSTTGSGSGTITVTDDTDASAAEAVAAKDLSSVVTIYVYSDTSNSWSQLFGNSSSGSSSSSEPSALGSGVVIQQDGDTYYILTNYHVVEGISKAVVKVGDNQYEASSVGYDSKSDLAVIKITDDNNDLTVAEWGDSDSLVVGQWVAAIGSPYGYENTLTTGVVSAKYRSDVLSSESGVGSTVYTDMIQTDAAINPGNSGGGLFDSEGKLVGINTYISSTSESSAGLGFAIPASTAKDVADQLISGKTVEHAYLGISMSASSDGNGVTVAAVYKGTAAAKAGLQTGDVITKIDDTDVTSTDDVSEAVSSHSVGDTITITYTRDGKESTATATLGSDSDASTDEYAENGEPESSNDSNGNSGNSGSGSGDGSGNSGNGYGYGYGGLEDLFGDMFGYGSGSDSGSGSGSGSSNSGNSGSDSSGSFWE